MSDAVIASPSSVPYNPYVYRRARTRVVNVGSVAVGGENPIRVQSMTTTDTMDTEGTIAQVLRLAEAGCEIARITAPTVLDAKNLEKIKSGLLARGCAIPLVADIHFRPDAAIIAADFVEKVRINPGNFVDGKAFRVREYSDDEYASELGRIEERFTPLVEKLKRLGRAIRIGTNHGSLSDRVMNRYGDTPEGMVESALEFVRICERNDYRDIILSMKASNPRIMIAAYRLLVRRMAEEGMAYPLHLGVTEAGDGEDGRIKSAAGIGSLLEDGIGDTIRVSLTEDPEREIPVAREIARRYSGRPSAGQAAPAVAWYTDSFAAPTRRSADPVMVGPIAVGGAAPIRLASVFTPDATAGERLLRVIEERVKRDVPPEILLLEAGAPDFEARYRGVRGYLDRETRRLSYWLRYEAGNVPAALPTDVDAFVYRFGDEAVESDLSALMEAARRASVPLVLLCSSVDVLVKLTARLKNGRVPLIVGLYGPSAATVHGWRRLALGLREANVRAPLFLSHAGAEPTLDAAIVLGSLICDGLGDVVSVSEGEVSSSSLDFGYNLLQACGSRITKTEFVSCPSCGRTLFDLQSTTERIKSKTGHLKGVKIAIMGCIVNGPGEMADADFGYVGGGPGKINLYVGKTCVEKSIPTDVADEKLVDLIKAHGKWSDPPL